MEELKIALPVNALEEGLVSAAELEKRLTELMNSDKGRAVRERVTTMRDGAAVSRLALAKLAESLKQGRGNGWL